MLSKHQQRERERERENIEQGKRAFEQQERGHKSQEQTGHAFQGILQHLILCSTIQQEGRTTAGCTEIEEHLLTVLKSFLCTENEISCI
jgi:hypothetical protein